MNKKMRELSEQINTLTLQAKAFMEGENKDVGKANELLDKVEELQKELDTERRIMELNKNDSINNTNPIKPLNPEGKDAKLNDAEKFAKGFRAIMKGTPAGQYLVESVDDRGGYTVPEDIQTKINHWKEVKYSFEQDISVETVSTNKGSRTYQKKGSPNGFVDVDENGAITGELDSPKYERISYVIQNRAGFMPVSNDLIDDSDTNIITAVVEWIGDSARVTTNQKVLEKIALKEQVDLKDLDGIKHAVNVTLGQAYKSGAKIYTNDDGLNYLDTLKDQNGRPLLNPDPTDAAKIALRCGVNVLPVKVLPNAEFETKTNKIPFIVGDLKDYIKKYVRKETTIAASNTATLGDYNAFATNTTLLRVMERNDYEVMDKDSIVNGYITVAGE